MTKFVGRIVGIKKKGKYTEIMFSYKMDNENINHMGNKPDDIDFILGHAVLSQDKPVFVGGFDTGAEKLEQEYRKMLQDEIDILKARKEAREKNESE